MIPFLGMLRDAVAALDSERKRLEEHSERQMQIQKAMRWDSFLASVEASIETGSPVIVGQHVSGNGVYRVSVITDRPKPDA